MGKKRRDKKMNSTAAKVINFSGYHKKNKNKAQTISKAEKTMSQESIKSSYDFKKKSWERD